MGKENIDFKNPSKVGIERPGQITPDTATERIDTHSRKKEDKTEYNKKDNSTGHQNS